MYSYKSPKSQLIREYLNFGTWVLRRSINADPSMAKPLHDFAVFRCFQVIFQGHYAEMLLSWLGDVGWRNPPGWVTLSDTSIKFLIYKTGWFQICPFATLTIGWSPPNDHHFSNFIPFHQPATGCSNMFQHPLGETRHVWWTYSNTQKTSKP